MRLLRRWRRSDARTLQQDELLAACRGEVDHGAAGRCLDVRQGNRPAEPAVFTPHMEEMVPGIDDLPERGNRLPHLSKQLHPLIVRLHGLTIGLLPKLEGFVSVPAGLDSPVSP